jgi:hypothetical protein
MRSPVSSLCVSRAARRRGLEGSFSPFVRERVARQSRTAAVSCRRFLSGVGCKSPVGSIERGDHPAAVTAYVRLARSLDLSLDELLKGSP